MIWGIETAIVAAALFVCSYTDIKRFEVEDKSLIICGGLIFSLIIKRSVMENSVYILTGALAAALIALAGGFILCHFGMGFGDVKCMMLIAAAKGMLTLTATLLIGSLCGAAYGLVKNKANVKKEIQFVPFILIGYIVSVIYEIYIII